MASIDWTNGQLITLTSGQTARCLEGLNQAQLYGLFFYNATNGQASTEVLVSGSQGSGISETVTVGGTTANKGPATVLFVSGDDTDTISAAVLQGNSGDQVNCFIGSVKMPTNTTGINNWELPSDGQRHQFSKFTRYYFVPESHPYVLQIDSDINQFIVVRFTEQHADVVITNSPLGDLSATAGDEWSPPVSGVKSAKNMFTIKAVNSTRVRETIRGYGEQIVWINADSVQDSEGATIALQSVLN